MRPCICRPGINHVGDWKFAGPARRPAHRRLQPHRKTSVILNPSRILKSTAFRYAHDTAIINFERNRRFTYQQVREITNRACHMLAHTFGLDENSRIATLVRNDHMSLLY